LNGLLHSKFNDWKRSRKLLSNLFHFEVLRDRRKIIEEIVDKNISNLKDRKELDIFREMDIITGRVVL
jgi:cytochrome P450